jgi:hypothetical protein
MRSERVLGGRTIVAGLVAMVAGLGVGVGLVAARDQIETDSLIFVTQPNTLNGNVTSPKPGCIPDRKVTVKKKKNGPDKRLAKRHTGSSGFWNDVALPHPFKTGQAFYAAIAERHVSAGLCEATHSNTTTVGP